MNQSKKSVDILHGPLALKIILFSLPIAFSSMLQQLFNAADTSVVGHFADANALAAVGTNGEIIALLVTLSTGLAVGANVLIARCIGEKNISIISDVLHTAIMFAAIIGIFAAVLGQFIAMPVLIAIKTPQAVLIPAVLYLRIYFIGYPFLMLYNFGSAILRARGDSTRPFIALTISGVINVLLNLLFVIVCKLGVAGVSIATDISTAISAGMVLYWLTKDTSEFHLAFSQFRIHKKHLAQILIIGVPSAVQGAVFCFANIFVQASVNSFGAIATAGSTISMNFEYFGYYMTTAFGQAATTFASQNFAAALKKRCRKILWLSLVFSVIFSALITVPLTVFRVPASALFTTNNAVIESAAFRIIIILTLQPICCFYEIPAGFLRGCGYSTLPAVLTVIGTCIVRIVWIFTVFRHYHTLGSLFVVFPISWIVTILLVFIGCYFCFFHPKKSAEAHPLPG